MNAVPEALAREWQRRLRRAGFVDIEHGSFINEAGPSQRNGASGAEMAAGHAEDLRLLRDPRARKWFNRREREIISNLANGLAPVVVRRRRHCHFSAVKGTAARWRAWKKNIDAAPPLPAALPKRIHHKKSLTPDQRAIARAYLRRTVTLKEFCAANGVCPSTLMSWLEVISPREGAHHPWDRRRRRPRRLLRVVSLQASRGPSAIKADR